MRAVGDAQRLLVLRRPRQALRAAADCLNTLACPGHAPPEEEEAAAAATEGALTLPALLPLNGDDECTHERSGPPMAVLLQALCELGEPQLAAEAVHACYMDLACAPFEVIWLGAQALARHAPEAAASFATDWLAARPPPRTLTPERRQRLLRLLLLRLLPASAARHFLDERVPGLVAREELAALATALGEREAPPTTTCAVADAAASAREAPPAAGPTPSAEQPRASTAPRGSAATAPADAAGSGTLAGASPVAHAAAAQLVKRLRELGPEVATAALAPLCVALVALAARLVLPAGWWALCRRRLLQLGASLLVPLRLALGASSAADNTAGTRREDTRQPS